MCEYNLAFFMITLAILWSQQFCKGATHWTLTEDGRIQQQADSIFNLKSPYDLVTFIHQQNAYDRLKVLREEYLEEKRKVIEAREKEREEIQKSFYKVDSDCVDAGKHISEFELHLEMTLPFSKKGIDIPDHVNLCQPLPPHLDPPYCRTVLPTVIYSYDHLEGVNGRYQLNTSAEPLLLSGFSSYFKTVEELGGRVSLALEQNSSSWVLLNLAAYYWRIKGNALEAVECLRQALYFSPREDKDRALMSLAAVLHHTNHSDDSLVLLHTAIDIGNELSVYHFLLGNIYASMKLYEMAELCHQFTLVVSPDTDSLCERVKAVRCELKLKELLRERQLDFDETLDSLKTPELELTKELSGKGVMKKKLLPLEMYKRQLEQVFMAIQGAAKQTDTCKSRPGPTKHDLHLSFDHAKPKEKDAGQVSREEAEKSLHRQEDANHDRQTENTSSGIQGKTLEKSMIITEDVKATSYSEISGSQGSSDTNNEDSVNSIEKERGKTSETLEATNFSSDSSNISMEEKTMQNLAEARVALKRLKSIIKTVSQARHSALNTVDAAEEKSSQSDSDIGGEDGAKTAQSKVSSIKSTQTVVEKQSTVQKAGNPHRTGRRGESGLIMPKSHSGRREDKAKTVISEETKFAKQKGESVVINKNGPGLKLDKVTSKNTREISDSELLFEEPKGSHLFGPKHTPPLDNKDVLVQAKKCQNVGRKKRKGEAFTMECLTQDVGTQTQGSTSETDLLVQKFVSKTEFSKPATNSEQTGSDLSQLQSNAEKVLIKQTFAEEILTTTSSNINASDRSSDAKVLEKSERKTSSVDDAFKSVIADEKGENAKENSETPLKGDRHSDSKAAVKKGKASTEDVIKRKAGDKQSESEKSNGKSSINCDEKSEMKTTKDGEKIIPSDQEREMKHDEEVASKNSDAKVLEKNELKISAVEDDGKSKTNDKEVKTFKEPSLENEKSEVKIHTAGNVKSKSSDNGNENLKQHERATSGKNPETTNRGHRSTSSKPKKEQTDTDSKSRKTINSDKAGQNIKEKIKEAEFLHKVGAGSNVFETSFLNVHTSGSLHELSDEECKHIEGVHALVIRNKQFSAWLSLDTKNIDVRTHVDFLSEVDELPKKPRCTAKIKNNPHTFGNLQGVANADKLEQVAEAGLTQTLLTIGRTIQDGVDEMGTRIYNALKKNSTSWVMLNMASLYWRVQGDTAEAIKCLRQALYFSPPDARDVAHVGLASILLREGHLDDTAVVIKKALEISPSLALGHFILGNVFGAQSNIPEAIQHYLLALQLEPGFTPAVERLKIIQCVLWKQQKALEKEANDLRKLLATN